MVDKIQAFLDPYILSSIVMSGLNFYVFVILILFLGYLLGSMIADAESLTGKLVSIAIYIASVIFALAILNNSLYQVIKVDSLPSSKPSTLTIEI